MTCRAVLSLCALVAGLSSIGCTGSSNDRRLPTSPSQEQSADSGNASRPPQEPRPEPPPATGTCVAERAQGAVGQPASRTLLERARVEATATVARFIRPNEAITMEFSPGRLNLYLDERDIVRSVVCG
jgi:hypothetical protein